MPCEHLFSTAGDTCSDSRTRLRAENIIRLVLPEANVAYFKWLLHVAGTLFDHFDFFDITLLTLSILINNITRFRIIQLFVFVFGRIVHRTIRIRPNSLKPLFGASLKITQNFLTTRTSLLWHSSLHLKKLHSAVSIIMDGAESR